MKSKSGTIATQPTPGDTSWFVDARFGLFIHWGLYALPARHEWVMQRENMDPRTYRRYFDHFEPDRFQPEQWADEAAAAGMKYMVVTTKHHEGFCLWDSHYTRYKATEAPLCRRDLLTPIVEAFRARGLRIGLYHSLIDWHHPDFRIDDIHALRDDPKRAKMNEKRNQARYAEYLENQITELLTLYDPVDILWLDFSYPSARKGKQVFTGKGRNDWNSRRLYRRIRELAPNIILNDRLDMPDGFDVVTPEQFQPRTWMRHKEKPVVWEACQTLSGSWGYHRDEQTWKSPGQLIRMLVDTVSKGGNLLMNVGPTARGELDARAQAALRVYERWMQRHGRSIYGCTQAPANWTVPPDCRLTWNPGTHRVYLHVFAWPFLHVSLEGWKGRVAYAQFLHDGSEVLINREPLKPVMRDAGYGDQDLILELPVRQPDDQVPVIELFLAPAGT